MNRSSLAFVALVLVGCKDKAPDAPPPPAPTSIEAPVPAPAPAKPPALQGPTVRQPSSGFTGFSNDGTKFAWLAPSASGGDARFLKIASVGQAEPALKTVYPDDESQKEMKAKLVGFSTDRRPAPAELSLAGDITTTPPHLDVVRDGKRAAVPVGEYPFPPTDAAEIWGMSADGKHLAVHIGGKDVPGLLSKGGGEDFHTFFVVALP
jgi:hypothetical protein